MICIDRFPRKQVFRGIGQLDVEQMASITKVRQPVTEKMLALAVSGWAVFRSSDPNDLLAFLETDLSDLPFLATALRRHLEKFPEAGSGLNRTETQLLHLIGEGVKTLNTFFAEHES